ncbi:MAG: citrate lyase holo-[acyl-carrier protein] synthase [Clostridiaceae bacterium]
MENLRTKDNGEYVELGLSEKKMTSALFEEIQNYRKRKCQRIEGLHKEFNAPVITLGINYPGIMKNNELTELIITEVGKQFEEIFQKKILYSKFCSMKEGSVIYYVVKGDSRTLKENTIYLEQTHGLGRFVNVDVFDHDEEFPITRIELSHEPRKCYLCHEDAALCEKNKTHSHYELINFMQKNVDEYFKLNLDTIH